ncbi:MAG: hypothetical protein GC164_04890 [Phycisphaera sp.]|nr:hypothetical protein [Phycisphaera sp.]
MSDEVTIDFDQPISLFPLPGCVLLPHAIAPLHIFEPRYRAMVGDALDAAGLIAMATFEGNAWRRDYEGTPPIRPYLCVGYIARHDKLPDGRYNILLQGLCRARLVEEVASTPYRQAYLEPIEHAGTMEIDLTDHRRRLEELLNDPLLAELTSVSSIQRFVTQETPTIALVDLGLMAMCENVEQRYEMLADSQAESRSNYLENKLRQTRNTLSLAKKLTPNDLPDHMSMN